ncbi:MAG TPA: hypothetical protein VLM37_03220 [Fibrobacteraceae bacterium]|nr:hypothetical protein [Fibrobacteraceae bacterium]
MPAGDSRLVESDQKEVHPDLQAVVSRHLHTPYRKPIAEHTRQAFASVSSWVETSSRPLILDSGCGTGESSYRLALAHVDSLVLGIDKSEVRLDKAMRAEVPENLRLLRADLVDFWMLAHAAGWRLAKHYLLYPNPWPRSRHLLRRWHGHPVFPILLSLGGDLELRTNWRIYAEEFAQALTLVTGEEPDFFPFWMESPMTAFERKFLASGHEFWRVLFPIKGASKHEF